MGLVIPLDIFRSYTFEEKLQDNQSCTMKYLAAILAWVFVVGFVHSVPVNNSVLFYFKDEPHNNFPIVALFK